MQILQKRTNEMSVQISSHVNSMSDNSTVTCQQIVGSYEIRH